MGLNAAVEPRTLRRSMHASASERIATIDSNDAVILEWRYTPANFFEEPIPPISRDDYEIRIENGVATATVAPEAYDEEHKKRDELHDVVEARFGSSRGRSRRTGSTNCLSLGCHVCIRTGGVLPPSWDGYAWVRHWGLFVFLLRWATAPVRRIASDIAWRRNEHSLRPSPGYGQ
jgi:hypothetical protein